MNRGYFGRVECVNSALQGFVKQIGDETTYQILNIGGGFDTLAFHVFSKQAREKGSDGVDDKVRVYEVDFPEVIQQKTRSILSKPALRNVLVTSQEQRSAPNSSFKISNGAKIGGLTLLSCDLREADSVVSSLISSSFDPSIPTFIISECVLVYISKSDVERLVQGVSSITQDALWISYDMINPSDSFGKVMVENLKAAGHRVPGLLEYPTLESQKQRFLGNGWHDAVSETFLQSFDTLIATALKKKIYRLEIFDELEEWNLLMSHYSLTVATRGSKMIGIDLKVPQEIPETIHIPISPGLLSGGNDSK